MATKFRICNCGDEHTTMSITVMDDFVALIKRCSKCNESIHETYNLSSITYFEKDGYSETVYIDK